MHLNKCRLTKCRQLYMLIHLHMSVLLCEYNHWCITAQCLLGFCTQRIIIFPQLSQMWGVFIHWTGLLDWTTGLDYWTGLLDWTTGLDYWTGLLDWTTGLDYWTGLLDWTTGLDYWTGLLDWTTGLDYWTQIFFCFLIFITKKCFRN